MKPLEASTFILILTRGTWPRQLKMKKMTMNSIFGPYQTVQTHPMKMEIEHGSILELKASINDSVSNISSRSLNGFVLLGPSNVTVKFNIMNLNRQAKLYSQGMKPLYKVVPSQEHWERIKEKPVCSVSFLY